MATNTRGAPAMVPIPSLPELLTNIARLSAPDVLVTVTKRERKTKSENSDVINAEDVASMLGLDIKTVYERLRDLPHRRIGRRIVFARSAIQEWLRGDSRPRQRSKRAT